MPMQIFNGAATPKVECVQRSRDCGMRRIAATVKGRYHAHYFLDVVRELYFREWHINTPQSRWKFRVNAVAYLCRL